MNFESEDCASPLKGRINDPMVLIRGLKISSLWA